MNKNEMVKILLYMSNGQREKLKKRLALTKMNVLWETDDVIFVSPYDFESLVLGLKWLGIEFSTIKNTQSQTLTIRDFMNSYVAINTKVRIVKSFEVLFEGAVDELYRNNSSILDNIVTMVGANENYLCVSCK